MIVHGFASLILTGAPGWTDKAIDLLPGGHVAIFTTDPEIAIEGRRAGLELRDTIAVLQPGPRTSFVMLFRRPSEEPTVVDQVVRSGTGALNVDGCRVAADLSEFFSGTGKPRSGAGHAKGYGMDGVFGGDKANPPNEAGRWPPNLVIVHGPGCRRTGERKVPGDARGAHAEAVGGRRPGGFVNTGADNGEGRPNARVYGDKNGLETVTTWNCDATCVVPFLDGQGGERRAGGAITTPHQGPAAGSYHGRGTGAPAWSGYGDTGGASRFYPQFTSHTELRAWVFTLITPGRPTPSSDPSEASAAPPASSP